MTPTKQPLQSTPEERIIETLVRLESIATIVEKLNENIEGTIRTKGLKEKITIAEFNIEANKQAYLAIQEQFKEIVRVAVDSIESKIVAEVQTIKRDIDSIDKAVKTLQKNDVDQNSFMERVKPYLGIFSWLTAGAGGVLLTMFLTGKLKFFITP